jgi:hypothetical protein
VQIEAALDEPKNVDALGSFMKEHCRTFEGEESALEHTEIHNMYVALLETMIEDKLSTAGLDMSKLMNSLSTDYLESRTEQKQVMRVTDVLNSLSDFIVFRASMLATKRELDVSARPVPAQLPLSEQPNWPELPDITPEMHKMLTSTRELENSTDFWNVVDRKYCRVDARNSAVAGVSVNLVRGEST